MIKPDKDQRNPLSKMGGNDSIAGFAITKPKPKKKPWWKFWENKRNTNMKLSRKATIMIAVCHNLLLKEEVAKVCLQETWGKCSCRR